MTSRSTADGTTPTVRRRRLPAAVLTVVAVAGLALVGSQSSALSRAFQPVPAPPANPTSSNQIQNIDQVRTAIKGYYGDTPTARLDPVDGTTTLHEASPDSAYAKEVGRLEKSASGYLTGAHAAQGTKKAVLLDVDDTSLLTYDYEIYSNFAFNPTTNAAFVNKAVFPAVFGMPQLVQRVEQQGYTVFFLTGRSEGQRAGTEKNLTDQGYPVHQAAVGKNVDNVFLKDVTHPWSTCDTTGDNVCTTIELKSETRRYIESLGYDIKANFGDQFSDLKGGSADKTFKLPNPMYFLP
ncbi:MAG: acid phosphatase [Nocardioidaceae bacterium]|nr:acid phosphatase [Nocardioidaceae bacterium]NUS51002.1 acid phosphatase [Nocardioidaceae bacterium]